MSTLDQPQAVAQAAVFNEGHRTLRIQQIAVPEPTPGEVLVRVECCTLCGSDLHTILGRRKELTPSILGHEILGRVDSIGGAGVNDVLGNQLVPGDRITWSVAASCGSCHRCENGLPQKCYKLFKYGHAVAEGRAALSGGLAEFVLLHPGTGIVKVSESIPAEVLCPVNCATATVTAAFRKAGTIAGKRVFVIGAGMLGLTAAAFANFHNAEEITTFDIDSNRLELARSFGADRTICDKVESLRDRYDVILELSGARDAVDLAFQLGDIGAQILLVGSVMPMESIAVDPEQVVRRLLSIHGIHNYTPDDLLKAVQFLSSSFSRYPFEKLVSKSFRLTEVNSAVTFAIEEKPIRVAVKP